jgi:RNA polymerase sigma factor (sigma-70 family)
MHPSLLQATRSSRETLKGKDIGILAQRAQVGDTGARDELILGHLWLVDRLAHELDACPLAVEDRFSEGIFGLARAVQLFDPGRGVLFASYARYWIRHAIQRAGDDYGRTIRITVCMVGRLRMVGKMEEVGTSDCEILEQTGLSLPQLAELRSAAALRKLQSLDAPLGTGEQDEETSSLGEVLPSDVTGPDDLCQNQDLSTTLRNALDALDPVDRRLVEMVYGLSERRRTTTVGQAARALRLNPAKAKWFMARAMASMKEIFYSGQDNTLLPCAPTPKRHHLV